MDNMMTYEEFTEKIRKSLECYFDDGSSVRLCNVKKNNGIEKCGVSLFSNKCNLSPTVYLEEYYSRYEQGEVPAQIIHEIITIFEDNRNKGNFDIGFFTEFDSVSDRIMCKLINAEMNEELLSMVPHIRYMDLAVVFFYLFPDDDAKKTFGRPDIDSRASILIYQSHLDLWGKNLEDLKKAAYENTQKLSNPDMIKMDDLMLSLLERRGSYSDCENLLDREDTKLPREMVCYDQVMPQMFILTNRQRQYGATVMLYEGILKKVADKIGSGYYVIPSSVHEVILVPDSPETSVGFLKNMVREVNRTELARTEVLSDSVYYYNPLVDELSVC